MKTMHKVVTLFFTLALCVAMSVPAFAGNCDSPIVNVTFEGQDYNIGSTLFKNGSRYRSATWIQTSDFSTIPVGGVQVQTFLMSSDGELDSSGRSTLNTADYFHVAYTPYRATAATDLYATGTAYIKSSSGSYKSFSSGDAYESGLSRSLLARGDQLTKSGNFPVNSNGETYGSLALAQVVGTEPELISAIGTEGQSGYVRCADLFADYEMAGSAGRYIPLYDVNGNDIGSFMIYFNNPSETAGKDIQEVYSILADGYSENPQLWELADQTLVNGTYPVNSNGETYGNYTLRHLVGYAPELVRAVNEAGISGYIRHADMPITDPINGRTSILLYDKEGNIIDKFDIGSPEVSIGGSIEQSAKILECGT